MVGEGEGAISHVEAAAKNWKLKQHVRLWPRSMGKKFIMGASKPQLARLGAQSEGKTALMTAPSVASQNWPFGWQLVLSSPAAAQTSTGHRNGPDRTNLKRHGLVDYCLQSDGLMDSRADRAPCWSLGNANFERRGRERALEQHAKNMHSLI